MQDRTAALSPRSRRGRSSCGRRNRHAYVARGTLHGGWGGRRLASQRGHVRQQHVVRGQPEQPYAQLRGGEDHFGHTVRYDVPHGVGAGLHAESDVAFDPAEHYDRVGIGVSDGGRSRCRWSGAPCFRYG